MKKLNNIYLVLGAFIYSITPLIGQTTNIKIGEGDDEKIKVNLGGRILFDGAAYINDDTPFSNGVTISDTRLTLKATYKLWDIKMDIGLNDKKVNTKDLHIRYNFNKHSWLRLGYYCEQFGLENWEGSAWQKFMAPATSDQVFGTGRQIGLTYANWNNYFYYSGGIFADNDALSNTKTGNQGFGVVSKVSYNPINSNGNLLHIGISGELRNGYRNGYDDDKRTIRNVTYASNLTSKVDKQKPLNLTINDVDLQAKYVAELMATTGPAFLQGEYYHSNVKRKHDLSSFVADGFYVQSGVMLMGDKTYKYDLKERKLVRPKDKTLELVLRYNYTNLNHKNSDPKLKGGLMSDVTVGLNYYFSKYFGAKLNYSFVKLGKNCAVAPDENVNVIQGRFFVTF